MGSRLSFMALLLIIFAAPAIVQGQQSVTAAGSTAYLKLKSIDGKMYDVADMKGSVVVVSFGATWCQPCVAELAALEDLQKEYAGKPVKFLWVSVERREQITDGGLKAFAKQHKLSMPVLRDPTQLTYAQFSNRVRLPLIVLFNADGKVDGPTHFGMSSPEHYAARIRARIDGLLSNSGQAAPISGR
jgi:thiol-disulfide isomerase/thioredoxin